MTKTSLTNRVPTAILSSPLHPLLSSNRLVLGFTGRRSGTHDATPDDYLQQDRELLITPNHRWWRTREGGARVSLRLRGRRVQATAHAVRDPEQVAAALTALITAHPPYRRWANVRLGPDGLPEPAGVTAEVTRDRVPNQVELPAEQPAGARSMRR
jgi:hypothetical protein